MLGIFLSSFFFVVIPYEVFFFFMWWGLLHVPWVRVATCPRTAKQCDTCSVSSRTEFKQGDWVLTLLSLNIIIMDIILAMKREWFSLQAYAICTWIVTVYALSTMCACAVYTTTQPLVVCLWADCGKPKIPTTLGNYYHTANHYCSCQHYCKPATHKQGRAPLLKYSSGNTATVFPRSDTTATINNYFSFAGVRLLIEGSSYSRAAFINLKQHFLVTLTDFSGLIFECSR